MFCLISLINILLFLQEFWKIMFFTGLMQIMRKQEIIPWITSYLCDLGTIQSILYLYSSDCYIFSDLNAEITGEPMQKPVDWSDM